MALYTIVVLEMSLGPKGHSSFVEGGRPILGPLPHTCAYLNRIELGRIRVHSEINYFLCSFSFIFYQNGMFIRFAPYKSINKSPSFLFELLFCIIHFLYIMRERERERERERFLFVVHRNCLCFFCVL